MGDVEDARITCNGPGGFKALDVRVWASPLLAGGGPELTGDDVSVSLVSMDGAGTTFTVTVAEAVSRAA